MADIKTVGVIGAGQMGTGIALVCALAGYEIELNDVSRARIDAGISLIEHNMQRQIARGIIDLYQPRKRLDVGTWGVMGIGMGYCVAAAIETKKPVLAIVGDSAFGFSAIEIETVCRYNLPVCIVVFNNNGI